MRQYPFMEKKAGKVCFGIFLFLMLFLARDTLVTSSILGFNRAQFLMLGVLCVFGLIFLVVNRRNLKEIVTDKRMLAFLVTAVVILFPMVAKQDWQVMYFSILLGSFTAVFLTYFISYRDVAKYYIVILTVLGAYSVLATYPLRFLMVDQGLMPVPVFFNQIEIKFHNFGLAFVSDSFVEERNFGIFREPGVYQYFLIVGLFLNNYVVEWKKQRTLWIVNGILAVTMLTTLATGGVLELFLLAFVVFIDKKLHKNKWAWVVIGVVAGLLAAVVAYIIAEQGSLYWELYSMVIGKFQPGEESAVERFEAIFADIDFFLKNPLVGEKLSVVLHAVANNTTSTLVMFASFGIVGGVWSVLIWVALVWDRERKVWVNLGLLAILLLSFNTQNLTADVFFWLFPTMAAVEKWLPKGKVPAKKV